MSSLDSGAKGFSLVVCYLALVIKADGDSSPQSESIEKEVGEESRLQRALSFKVAGEKKYHNKTCRNKIFVY